MPKLRQLTFETAIIERYRRRESSVEEALIEMYLAGRVGPARGGHHRGAVGHTGQPQHGLQPSTRRSTARSKRGGTGRSRASTLTCTWTASG